MNLQKLILIVDDDPDDLDLFMEAVHDVDESVLCIPKKDGNQALDFLISEEQRIPDFIFLDLNMPRLNGLQCLELIKRIKRIAHVPVIIYSTTSKKEDVDESKKLGAITFLTKPPSYPEICNNIRFILKGQA
jgi:CheY-like chemotaxis protein